MNLFFVLFFKINSTLGKYMNWIELLGNTNDKKKGVNNKK